MLSSLNIVSLDQGKNIPSDFREAWLGKPEAAPAAEEAKVPSRGRRLVDVLSSLRRAGRRQAA